ncbi:PiggyBac transposable element-derived protein 3 [Frankliniella fusca]|uniref:PiggyBac transposable element-derived protein 3 n=1 Tax=Frankliniella fusca TaxID=407009 RepID=A0AAE1I2V7_9NEOP|nr:PiggyBac transposable element-derived protein 3 [Frankliniella fusca]
MSSLHLASLGLHGILTVYKKHFPKSDIVIPPSPQNEDLPETTEGDDSTFCQTSTARRALFLEENSSLFSLPDCDKIDQSCTRTSPIKRLSAEKLEIEQIPSKKTKLSTEIFASPLKENNSTCKELGLLKSKPKSSRTSKENKQEPPIANTPVKSIQKKISAAGKTAQHTCKGGNVKSTPRGKLTKEKQEVPSKIGKTSQASFCQEENGNDDDDDDDVPILTLIRRERQPDNSNTKCNETSNSDDDDEPIINLIQQEKRKLNCSYDEKCNRILATICKDNEKSNLLNCLQNAEVSSGMSCAMSSKNEATIKNPLRPTLGISKNSTVQGLSKTKFFSSVESKNKIGSGMAPTVLHQKVQSTPVMKRPNKNVNTKPPPAVKLSKTLGIPKAQTVSVKTLSHAMLPVVESESKEISSEKSTIVLPSEVRDPIPSLDQEQHADKFDDNNNLEISKTHPVQDEATNTFSDKVLPVKKVVADKVPNKSNANHHKKSNHPSKKIKSTADILSAAVDANNVETPISVSGSCDNTKKTPSTSVESNNSSALNLSSETPPSTSSAAMTSTRSSQRRCPRVDYFQVENSDSDHAFSSDSEDDFDITRCTALFDPMESEISGESDTDITPIKPAPKKLPREKKLSQNPKKNPAAADTPAANMCFNWKPGDIETQERPCPEMDVSDEVLQPIDYFCYFWDDDLFQRLADQTNLYSTQRDGSSLNVTKQEMKIFFGIWLYMGICRLPQYEDYWNSHTRVPQVADLMPLKRYEKIRSRLHIADNNLPHDGDRLAKVRPLLNHIRGKCNALEQKENKFSIDESMVLYKGKKASNIKQYMPKKPHKWGFKFFLLCGVSGIVYDFIPYLGEDTFQGIDFTEEQKKMGKGAQTVIALCKQISHPRLSVVCFDNYFTSIPLLKNLQDDIGLLSIGTVKSNRTSHCPLLDDKALSKIGRGAVDSKVLDDKIVCVKWVDSKVVTLASTYTGVGDQTSVMRWNKNGREEVSRPDIVKQYNSMMGGVDKFDMLSEIYRTMTRSKRWYIPLVGYMISMALVNSWLMYEIDCLALQEKGATSSKKFRLDVFNALVASETRRGRPPANEPKAKKLIISPVAPRPVDAERRDNTDHWPGFGEKRQRCRNCQEGFSEVICLKCNMCLCFRKSKNCFVQFHRLP